MEILIVRIVKALAEVGGMFLLGQGALYLLTGPKRTTNFMYQLFSVLTRPLMRMARALTPKVVADQHIPIVALMLMVWIWIVAVLVLGQLCAGGGVAGCPTAQG